jgi:hypothetical protein
MSSVLILILFLLLAAPAFFAFWRRDLGLKTGAFYGAVLAGLVAWHLGFSIGDVPSRDELVQARAGTALEGSRCEQALTAAERGGIVIDRSNPNRLVVNGAIWQQLPQDVRAPLAECANTSRPIDQRERPVEIVERLR